MTVLENEQELFENSDDECADKHVCRLICPEFLSENHDLCTTNLTPNNFTHLDVSMVYQRVPQNEAEQAQKQTDRNFMIQILSGRMFMPFKFDETSKNWRQVFSKHAKIPTLHLENVVRFTQGEYRRMIIEMLRRGENIPEIFLFDTLASFQRLLDSFKDFCKKKKVSPDMVETELDKFLKNPQHTDPIGANNYFANFNKLSPEWKIRAQDGQKELLRYFVDNFERRDFPPCHGITYWWGITRYWEGLRGQVNLRSPLYVAEIEKWIQSIRDVGKQTCCPDPIIAPNIIESNIDSY